MFAALDGIRRAYLGRAADRSAISHGAQSGDCRVIPAWSGPGSIVRRACWWSGRPESFKSVQHGGFVDALPETDYTAKMLLA